MDLRFCQKDTYLIVTLRIGVKYVYVVKDMTTGLYLDQYFVLDTHNLLQIIHAGDAPELVLMLPDEFGMDKVLSKVVLDPKTRFIGHTIQEEEITSVVRYFKKHHEKLIDNHKQFEKFVKEVHRFLNTESFVEIKMSGDGICLAETKQSEFKLHIYPGVNNQVQQIYVSLKSLTLIGNQLLDLKIAGQNLYLIKSNFANDTKEAWRFSLKDFVGNKGDKILNDVDLATQEESKILSGSYIKDFLFLEKFTVAIETKNQQNLLLGKHIQIIFF